MNKLYYCVVKNFHGEIEVVSYLGKTKREEMKIAKKANEKLLWITTDADAAHKHAEMWGLRKADGLS